MNVPLVSTKRWLSFYAATAMAVPVLHSVALASCYPDSFSGSAVLFVVSTAPLFASPALFSAIVAWRLIERGVLVSRLATFGFVVLLAIPMALIVGAHAFDVSVSCLDPEQEPILPLTLLILPIAAVPPFVTLLVYWPLSQGRRQAPHS